MCNTEITIARCCSGAVTVGQRAANAFGRQILVNMSNIFTIGENVHMVAKMHEPLMLLAVHIPQVTDCEASDY